MALAAFTCVMVLAFCGLGSAPAKAIGGSATDWMSQGKFGVMTHYLAENCPLSSDRIPATSPRRTPSALEQYLRSTGGVARAGALARLALTAAR
ncbi:hypothetical protein JBE27_02665 [Streptomyces albiflaviniger]|nr:hypothetical protein [Streptomyces albiflaviniger]